MSCLWPSAEFLVHASFTTSIIGWKQLSLKTDVFYFKSLTPNSGLTMDIISCTDGLENHN